MRVRILKVADLLEQKKRQNHRRKDKLNQKTIKYKYDEIDNNNNNNNNNNNKPRRLIKMSRGFNKN